MMQKSAKMMKNCLKLLRKRFFDIFASVCGPEDVSNGVGHHLDAYIWKKWDFSTLGIIFTGMSKHLDKMFLQV